MSTVKDVQERSGSSAVNPPAAPSLTEAGFPKAQHRSQRISHFKRARGATPTASGYPTAPPTDHSDAEMKGVPNNETPGRSNEAQALLKDCQGENEARVAQMSLEQRNEELKDLESIISPEVLAMLKKRAQKKAEIFVAPPQDRLPHPSSPLAQSSGNVSDTRNQDKPSLEKASEDLTSKSVEKGDCLSLVVLTVMTKTDHANVSSFVTNSPLCRAISFDWALVHACSHRRHRYAISVGHPSTLLSRSRCPSSSISMDPTLDLTFRVFVSFPAEHAIRPLWDTTNV